jgi:hypothetical protein
MIIKKLEPQEKLKSDNKKKFKVKKTISQIEIITSIPS